MLQRSLGDKLCQLLVRQSALHGNVLDTKTSATHLGYLPIGPLATVFLLVMTWERELKFSAAKCPCKEPYKKTQSHQTPKLQPTATLLLFQLCRSLPVLGFHVFQKTDLLRQVTNVAQFGIKPRQGGFQEDHGDQISLEGQHHPTTPLATEDHQNRNSCFCTQKTSGSALSGLICTRRSPLIENPVEIVRLLAWYDVSVKTTM